MSDETPMDIQDKPLAEALGERYLSYALSTIMARSLPDVRDGLKPVHRRLLFAMSQLNLGPDTPPKKSARVVGDVIGKFHPHGDVAVYDALVRLAQGFAVRYPLIDGQGNFGNIDGDNAAAMRYTEARLTAVAKAILDGIEEDAVDLRPTYDGDGDEPAVMPGAFPNLLANGSTGIAVGMATSIPPHNAGELCAALQRLIDHDLTALETGNTAAPDVSIEELVTLIPGPDMPTGGSLVEPRDAIVEAYRTGRGSFRIRARWEVEKLAQGTWQIIVTEIPYQVQKSRLIEKIAELLAARKLILLDDIRDESAEDIRLVLVPKSRNVDPAVLMESLFRASELETRFSLNMNVLDRNQVPQVMNLRQVLRAFLDHRREVLGRRCRHRLGKIDHRLEVLGGYLIVFLNIDTVIRIIREEDEPRPALMAQFGLTEVQAEAILNMRLRSLRRLEEFEIRKEYDGLTAERSGLQALLDSPPLQWRRIRQEIADIDARFGGTTALGRRRTAIADAPPLIDVPLEATVEREAVTVVCSEKGWIRCVSGHKADSAELRYKEGDAERFVLLVETTDKLLAFASDGRFYTLGVDKLPRGRGFGEPIRLIIDLGNDVEIVSLFKHVPGQMLIVAASDGRGFQVPADDVLAQTRSGKQVLNLAEGAIGRLCVAVEGDTVAVIGNNRRLLVFGLDELPVMARGRGVTLQRYKDGSLSDLTTFLADKGLSWKSGERTRVETDLTPWRALRGTSGRIPPNGFPRGNRFT
ncbi:MAG: DNA topoisomerase IV subunit A [Azospirillaceae bacterium]|nr:DNA topoisomerase IV subunit A [Azospirillaceae bacterium]